MGMRRSVWDLLEEFLKEDEKECVGYFRGMFK